MLLGPIQNLEHVSLKKGSYESGLGPYCWVTCMWHSVSAVTDTAAVSVAAAEVTDGDDVGLAPSWDASSWEVPSGTTSNSSPVESKQNLDMSTMLQEEVVTSNYKSAP